MPKHEKEGLSQGEIQQMKNDGEEEVQAAEREKIKSPEAERMQSVHERDALATEREKKRLLDAKLAQNARERKALVDEREKVREKIRSLKKQLMKNDQQKWEARKRMTDYQRRQEKTRQLNKEYARRLHADYERRRMEKLQKIRIQQMAEPLAGHSRNPPLQFTSSLQPDIRQQTATSIQPETNETNTSIQESRRQEWEARERRNKKIEKIKEMKKEPDKRRLAIKNFAFRRHAMLKEMAKGNEVNMALALKEKMRMYKRNVLYARLEEKRKKAQRTTIHNSNVPIQSGSALQQEIPPQPEQYTPLEKSWQLENVRAGNSSAEQVSDAQQQISYRRVNISPAEELQNITIQQMAEPPAGHNNNPPLQFRGILQLNLSQQTAQIILPVQNQEAHQIQQINIADPLAQGISGPEHAHNLQPGENSQLPSVSQPVNIFSTEQPNNFLSAFNSPTVTLVRPVRQTSQTKTLSPAAEKSRQQKR